MVWIPKEPKYKPKPPKPTNTPINTPINTPTDMLEGGNKMTNQEAIERMEMLRKQFKGAIITRKALDMAIEALKEHKSDGNWIDENDHPGCNPVAQFLLPELRQVHVRW